MIDRNDNPHGKRLGRGAPLRFALGAALAALLVATAGIGASLDRPAPGDPVVYEVADLSGKLLHLRDAGDGRLEAGDRVAGGAELRTGWFSAADLAVPRDAARFHLESRTHVRLGADDPSVLLVLEKGRLRALFDALQELAGEEEAPRERRIETPSAVLAVRGTEYGVAVGRNGATLLVVFEGVVEVLGPPGGPAHPGPVRVRAGHALHVRRGQPPAAPFRHGLTRHGWDRGATPPMGPPVGAGQGRTTPPGESGMGPGSESPRRGPPDEPPGQQGPPPSASGPGAEGAPAQGPPEGAPAPEPAPSPGPGPETGGGPPSAPPTSPGPPPAPPEEPPPGPPFSETP